MYSAAVVTVSDSSYNNIRKDESGPLVKSILEENGYEVKYCAVVSDDEHQIKSMLCCIVDDMDITLVITTGGTGFSQRDVTPEVTKDVCERMVPGIPEAMRYESLKITNRAMLSRSVAGIRKRSLIINLPGSPKAAKENLETILPALNHGLSVLTGDITDCCKYKEEI